MIEKLKSLFRKKAGKRYASTVPTGIRPLRDIHSAMVLVDVNEDSAENCIREVRDFFRKNGIKGEIVFLDLKKTDSKAGQGEILPDTISAADLNWYDRPSEEKILIISSSEPDMYISLVPGNGFTTGFLTAVSRASFKIGRTQSAGNIFDLVISEPEGKEYSQADIFAEVEKYLGIID